MAKRKEVMGGAKNNQGLSEKEGEPLKRIIWRTASPFQEGLAEMGRCEDSAPELD